jgi:hypothetical protein
MMDGTLYNMYGRKTHYHNKPPKKYRWCPFEHDFTRWTQLGWGKGGGRHVSMKEPKSNVVRCGRLL